MTQKPMDGVTRVCPHWLPALFRLTPPWSVYWDENYLALEFDQERRLYALGLKASVKEGWFFAEVEVTNSSGTWLLAGLRKEVAQLLADQVNKKHKLLLGNLGKALKADLALIEALKKEMEQYIGRYIDASERVVVSELIRSRSKALEVIDARMNSPHSKPFKETGRLKELLAGIQDLRSDTEQALQERNKTFVDNEWEAWKSFFALCEKDELTEEQGKAAITLEENTLLVAAAGSGKTSTIVGKVAYLLAKGLAKADEILCLAFNDEAAKEIGARLSDRLNHLVKPETPIQEDAKERLRRALDDGGKIESKTFHSFGKSILAGYENKKTSVSKESEQKFRFRRAIDECRKDPSFANKWWLLQVVLRFPQPSESRFQNEDDYKQYLLSVWRERKQKEGVLTLGSSSPVRSMEEVAIANWLYLMGVEFDYELPFKEGAAVLCPGDVWRPDFTYKVMADDGPRAIVHEHFGINAFEKAPAFFEDPEGYVRDAKKKQEVLKSLDHRHFWTTSAEFANGALFEKLEKKLKDIGVAFNPRPDDEVAKRLKDMGLGFDNEALSRAVSQIRSNEWSWDYLSRRISSQPDKARARVFLEVAFRISDKINDLLIRDEKIDFDEMIRRAVVYLREKPSISRYRIILADEFQDMAPGRQKLLRGALAEKPHARLFGVGDDWQAINRFAGADISLFTGFGKAFNRTAGGDAQCNLKKTFRSNQGIADVAKNFVLQNTSQLPKDVEARDKSRHAVIEIRTYKSETNLLALIEGLLQKWVDEAPSGYKPKVFLLGRYGAKYLADIDEKQVKALDEKWADRITLSKVKNKNKDRRKSKSEDEKWSMFTTMHSSKGQQADHVIILGMHGVKHNFFCFPGEREEDPLLELTLPTKEPAKDAEERRLFYVALTRAKHCVVLMTPDKHPSRYVLELLSRHRGGELTFNGGFELPKICDRCGEQFVGKFTNRETKEEFENCNNFTVCKKRKAVLEGLKKVAR